MHAIFYPNRCDQYRWVHKGLYDVISSTVTLKKRSNVVDSKQCSDRKQGNDQFHRWEYWGYKDFFMLHYTGDHTAYEPFEHRNAKHIKRPYIRSAPFVKEKVICQSYINNIYIYIYYFFNYFR